MGKMMHFFYISSVFSYIFYKKFWKTLLPWCIVNESLLTIVNFVVMVFLVDNFVYDKF